MSTTQLVSVDGADLSVTESGEGVPVVFVHGGLIADSFAPVCDALGGGYRLVRYHRRGYAGSAGRPGPVSIDRDAADCVGVLDALGIGRAHVVGWSHGGAVALGVAAAGPERVASVAVLEPALFEVPGAAALADALAPIVARYGSGDPAGAAADFQTAVWGADWPAMLERRIPGGVGQLEKDAALMFESDLPALQAWSFGPDQSAAVTHPVLMLAGTDTIPIVEDIRERMRELLPQTEEVLIEGANHSFAVTRPDEVATALAAFWARHRSDAGAP
ncbi:MAG: alpha/beta hydrolase [Pseudonocardia sp.]|nr:alpha/beta hydrolase [Pseudonocardia sp.]